MILTLILSGLALAALDDRAFELTITVRSRATTLGVDVRLGDLVDIEGADAQRVADARAVRLGTGPLPGFQRFVSVTEMRAALQRAGFDPQQLRFQGPDEVAVRVETDAVAGAELIEKGRAFLEQELAIFASDGVERQIELRQNLVDLSLPKAREDRRLEMRWPGLPQTEGNVTVQLVILVDGTRFRTIPLRYFVRVFQKVMITTRPLERGDRLSPSDFRHERQEVTALGASPVNADDRPTDWEMVRSTQPGTVLTAQNARRAELVSRDALVTIHYRRGTLQLRTLGKALEAGRRDDRIRIQNLGSERIISARVVGMNTVEILHR